MRITISSALTVLVLSALTAAFAQPIRTAGPQDTPLQESMETLNQGQRSLRKLIKAPNDNQASILGALGGMEHAVLLALREPPPRPEGQSDAEFALLRVGFKRTLAALLQQVLTLEQAALESDAEAMSAAYTELGRIKSAGHEKYQEP